MNRLNIVLLSILMLVIAAPTAMMAAPVQLSNTAKSKLEKVISTADVKVASSLRQQYSMLLKSQEQEQQWSENIKAIHNNNNEALIRVKKQINLIDATKLSKLESQLKQTKERYKPLFDSYTTLNKQIKAAKLINNKKLNSFLRTQADVMKIAVQLARQDIRTKEDILKTAKNNKAKTVKRLRAALSDIDHIKVKIKSEKSQMSTAKKRFTTVWKTLNETIKKGDAKSIVNALTSLITISKQVNEHQLKIYTYEKSINDIVLRVKSQVP